MKKKIFISIGIFISIVLVVYACLIITIINNYGNYKSVVVNYIKESTDYKDNLAVNKDKNESLLANDTTTTTKSEFGDSNVINILTLGIDRTAERDKTLGIYRADTISVTRIDLDTKEVKVLCIPRDTYAFIPDKNKMDKINHSYAYGSIKGKAEEYTINSVNNFIKYSAIDYYFAMDMEPVPEIVDSIGGVKLDVEIDMKTHGANLSKGLQILDGKKAFDYIHWRYSGSGDIDRIKRQQKFAKAVFKQLKDSGKLVDCVKLVWNYRNNIKTNMTLKQMISLAVLANDVPEGIVEYSLIPGSGKYMNKISYWIPDKEKTDKILKEFFSR